jgi:tRNA(fMet)-specific endonuclease VapC
VSLRYLLDTNTVSEPTRPSPNPNVLLKLREHRGELGIATVVWHELLFGWERLPQSRKKKQSRARLTAIGRPPSFLDGQIAAVAKVNGLILLTANLAHFECFDDLIVEGLGGVAAHS